MHFAWFPLYGITLRRRIKFYRLPSSVYDSFLAMVKTCFEISGHQSKESTY